MTTTNAPLARRTRVLGKRPWTELSLIVLMLAAAAPIAWMLILAFLPNRAIVSSSWTFPFWLGNFDEIFDSTFAIQIVNSIQVVAGTVILCLVIGSISGYAIAKLRPPRWFLLPCLMVAGFIPLIPPATLVPGFYLVLGDLGINGTLLGLILLNTFFNLPFAMLLLASYFEAVPEELREASLVDGAGEIRTFLSIMLPVIRPGLASVGVFVAIMAWNEFLMALTMTSGGEASPITVGIAGLLQPYQVTWGQMAAAGTIAAIPIILLAVFANRQIVAGLTAGAVKG